MVTGLEIKNLIQSHEYKRLLDKDEYEYGIKIYDNCQKITVTLRKMKKIVMILY